jgi:hypothetical protein
MMDFSQGDYEMPASMMAAIRYQDSRVGERGVRADWVWQFWQHDWIFRQESEVWGKIYILTFLFSFIHTIGQSALSHLCLNFYTIQGFKKQTPSLYASKFTHLLDLLSLNNRLWHMCHEIFSMASRLHSTTQVSTDLQCERGVLMHSQDTGDVRFVCLEKFNADLHTSLSTESPELGTDINRRPSSSTSTRSTFSSSTTARKRVIYAHSDILIRRSEYFATMLSSAFAEGAEFDTGGRKVYTVAVEEADFETVYWLLKFCYTNWLLFKEQDDPRAAVEGVGAGWSAKWLASTDREWDWKTFHKSGSSDEALTDTRSATSAESLGGATPGVSRSTSGMSEAFQPSTVSVVVNTTTSVNSITKPPSTSIRQPSRRATANSSALPAPVGGSSTPARTKPESETLSTSRYAGGPSKHYPISPRTSRPQQPSRVSPLDPHPHPTPAPLAASALSMYQVAHRYGMPGLAHVALEHMMATITPQASFALLLATTTWEELHTLIQVIVKVKNHGAEWHAEGLTRTTSSRNGKTFLRQRNLNVVAKRSQRESKCSVYHTKYITSLINV